MNQTYSISELANEFGITPRAVRFYEEKGLISPLRNGQDRVYSKRDRGRLILILRGKRLGFSLADIREMIDLYDPEDGQKEQLRVTLQKSRERIDALKQQRADIDDVLNELETSCEEIEVILKQKDVA